MADRIPGFNVLPAEKEREFQTFMAFDPGVRTWRNAFQNRFGEQPMVEGGDYDYRAAWAAGSRPAPVPGDTVPHWSSVGKTADHPTMWKEQFMQKFGVDPDQVQRWTPTMQEFMRRLIGRDPMPIPPGGLF